LFRLYEEEHSSNSKDEDDEKEEPEQKEELSKIEKSRISSRNYYQKNKDNILAKRKEKTKAKKTKTRTRTKFSDKAFLMLAENRDMQPLELSNKIKQELNENVSAKAISNWRHNHKAVVVKLEENKSEEPQQSVENFFEK
jgi:Na+-translocating ferredoxin:NAD+ oxidoreductase RnfC subunit